MSDKPGFESANSDPETTENKASGLKKSIVIRTGSALVGIALTALLSMFGSMLVAETLEGDAQAINLSGSMRMHSYRMANAKILETPQSVLEALVEEFETKLNSPMLSHIINTSDSRELGKQLDLIHGHWHTILKPLLVDPTIEPYKIMPAVDLYVQDIDNFVTALQNSSESKIRVLRALQGITVFIVILVSFIVLYNINQNIAIPLRDLVAAAQQIRSGNFKVVSHYKGDDELGLLATSFNQMSSELEVLYLDLEDRVRQKTAELQRSNDSLGLLYDATRKLYSAPNSLTLKSHSIFSELEGLIGLGTISLCLSKSDTVSAYKIITSNDLEKPSFCQAPSCDVCRHAPDKASLTDGLQEVVSFPLGKGKSYAGEITIEVPKGSRIEDWQRDLLNAVADVFYTTLSLSNLSEHESRIALMEERTVIARELHDSLAQSLSYQKLQVARLKRLHEKGADQDTLFSAIYNVQEGLNSSYKQLRELLGTFRIKIDSPGLEPALIGTVAEFKERSDIDIQLNYQLRDCPLRPNEEIHCLQIVREALSNVIKHAQASIAEIKLERDGEGKVGISIIDNGIGIPDVPHKNNHYGLSILSERTDSLNGQISIKRRPQGGTSVDLVFFPAFMHNAIDSEQTRA
ncbi:MAG: type IV pili methyl-accepting chemotaxis transducer N-terminal domain-containing protein [Pseudomonadales bacterium]|nr:type IV pili methyl-accepting chemotaxis transducer N-terminal domain-containing protein [Pseudomonadales bacterium]